MHEVRVIKELIDSAKKHGEVKSIVIEVGNLANIKGDHLRSHIKELADWKVAVKEKKGRVKCECGFVGEPKIMVRGHDFVLFSCPWCGDVPQILEGDKIILKEVTCA